jgi:hypothetical protein
MLSRVFQKGALLNGRAWTYAVPNTYLHLDVRSRRCGSPTADRTNRSTAEPRGRILQRVGVTVHVVPAKKRIDDAEWLQQLDQLHAQLETDVHQRKRWLAT